MPGISDGGFAHVRMKACAVIPGVGTGCDSEIMVLCRVCVCVCVFNVRADGAQMLFARCCTIQSIPQHQRARPCAPQTLPGIGYFH